MADYTFKHTDPANGVFVVHDNSADGPQSPSSAALYVNALTGLSAVSAETSLVFIGKSLAEYGEVVQSNILYVTENFANKTRPMHPMQGQVWYKNADYTDLAFPTDPVNTGLYIWYGATWGAIMISTGASLDLDMHNYHILNLADPVNPTDALNLQYADGRYLKLTGGTINGSLTIATGPFMLNAGVIASVTQAPTTGLHITNKTYVDGQDAALNTSLTNSINAVQNQLVNYVLKSGDTMTGTLTLGQNASLLVTAGGTGTIDLGTRRVQNIAAPTANTDATTKLYVDQSIATAIANIPPAPAGTSDGVVYAGSLDGSTGILTLQRTQGLPDVTVSGAFAVQNHTHTASQVLVDTDGTYPQSLIASAVEQGLLTTPTDSAQNVFRVLDQAITDIQRPTHRQLFVQTSGSNTTFTLEALNSYPVDEAKLYVFKNGIKQYATERGSSSALFNGNIGLNSLTGTADGSYTMGLNVSGTAYTIPVTASSLTYYELISQVADYIDTNSIAASVQIEQFLDRIYMHIKTNAVGTGQSVTMTAGTLFGTISSFGGFTNRAITTTYGYSEVGVPGDESVSFTFETAPAIGDVIEALITN